MQLIREDGFYPLEITQLETLNGAEALDMDDQLGTVTIGKLADFVIVEEKNLLQNFKVLYSTGAIKLTEKNEVVRVGGVKYTIKDGIVYDSKALLKDVKRQVYKAKSKSTYTIKQPGVKN